MYSRFGRVDHFIKATWFLLQKDFKKILQYFIIIWNSRIYLLNSFLSSIFCPFCKLDPFSALRIFFYQYEMV